MILKEEMKARSGSYDNDPWGSARNSRSGSKEALHSMSYNNTINGCECCPAGEGGRVTICALLCHLSHRLFCESNASLYSALRWFHHSFRHLFRPLDIFNFLTCTAWTLINKTVDMDEWLWFNKLIMLKFWKILENFLFRLFRFSFKRNRKNGLHTEVHNFYLIMFVSGSLGLIFQCYSPQVLVRNRWLTWDKQLDYIIFSV